MLIKIHLPNAVGLMSYSALLQCSFRKKFKIAKTSFKRMERNLPKSKKIIILC